MGLDTDLALTRHLATDGRLQFFRADKATVLFGREDDNAYLKLCLLAFNRKTGALFAQFTYFRTDPGVVGLVTASIGPNRESMIDWTEGGKVATNMVKYSHPPDGRAHFSQDGSHITQFRCDSIDLRTGRGRLFEIHAFHLEPFATLQKSEAVAKRLYLPFQAAGKPDGVSLTVEWERLDHVKDRIDPSAAVGPVALISRERDGARFKAALLAPPASSPLADGVLLVNVHPLNPPAGVTKPTLVFMGGWRPTDSLTSGTTASFLSFMYPADNAERLANTLGRADYTPNTDI